MDTPAQINYIINGENVMTQKLKLCCPSSMDNNLIDGLYQINKNIDLNGSGLYVYEIYCALQQTPFGGGRPSTMLPYMAVEQFEEHIKLAHDCGIKVNYLINSMCCGAKEYDSTIHRAMVEHLEWLYTKSIDSVTVANPFLVELVKDHFPDLKVCLSVNSEVNTPQRAQGFEKLGVDRIIIDNFINRKFDQIRSISKSVKCSIEALVNEPCLLNCPFRIYHQTLFGHGSQKGSNGLPTLIVDYPQLKCGKFRLNDPAEIIKAPWVRPEDIKHLSTAGVEFIKLSGRGQPTEWILKSAEAYSSQAYEGNIYALIEKQGLCSAEYDILLENKEPIKPFRFSIDNRKLDGFIDPFVEGKMKCEFGCDGCNYCNNVARKVVEYDHELANSHKERLEGALNTLTTSKFTESGIYNKLQGQLTDKVAAEA